MRLIDADALYDDIQCHWRCTTCRSSDVVKRRINRAPTIEPPANWTPCSVGLPEEHKTVLATVADEYGNDVMFAWHDSAGWQSGYEKNLPILAWMPAPKPYRGEA